MLCALAIAVAGSLLASCAVAPKSSSQTASKEYFSEKEYGVKASPKVVVADNAVPKGGGRYQVGKPYKVKGKTYRPKDDPDYNAVGLASWYGRAFHGRKTANGEVYDMAELTAAHPTLPLPSYARVTNVANNRSVVVRINDRGPFAKGRIIDLSAAAADMLDYKHAGTAKVKVEYVGRARMDGHDRQMLLSSYRGPNDRGGNALFASNNEPKAKRLTLASLNPLNLRKTRHGDDDRPTAVAENARSIDTQAVTAPAFLPTTFSQGDTLGPLILQTGFVRSYAPAERISRAHEAAADMAQTDTSSPVIQLGVFGDRGNAQAIASNFSRFGKVATLEQVSSGETLHIVRVHVDETLGSGNVLSAAKANGLLDAYVVRP